MINIKDFDSHQIKIDKKSYKNISEGIDINKTNASKECGICYYWYFSDKSFNYEPYLCNGCHNLMQRTMMLLLSLLKGMIIEFIFDI